MVRRFLINLYPCPCKVENEVSKSFFLFWELTFSVICCTEVLSNVRWLDRFKVKKAINPMACSKELLMGGSCENCGRKVRGVFDIGYICGEV